MRKNVTMMIGIQVMVLLLTAGLMAQDWQIVKQFDFNDALSQIIVLSKTRGYLLAGESLWEFTDHPGEWTRKADLPLREDPENPGEELSYSSYRMAAWRDTIVVVGSKGSIFISVDAGARWKDLSDTAYIDVTLQWVQGPDAKNIWIAGGTTSPRKGYILKIENLSEIIRQDNEDMNYTLSQVYFTNRYYGHAIAGGTLGDYFRTTDGGKSWDKFAGMFKGGSSGRIYDIAFANEKVGYAAGYYGYVYKTTDGGLSIWEQIETPEHNVTTNTYLPAIFLLGTDEFYVGGREGRLYYTKDGGANFKTQQLPSGNDFDSFWFAEPTVGLALSSSELLHNKSQGWEPVTEWVGEDWSALAVVGDDKLCLVASDNMVSLGPAEKLPHPTLASSGIYANLNGAYFMGEYGFLLGYKSLQMTIDAGETWTEILTADSGLGAYARDMAFLDSKTGYMCDSGGNLWKTSDGGKHWAPDTLLGSMFYRLILQDEKTWFVLDYRDAKVYKTTDGGETWTDHLVTDVKSYLYDMEQIDRKTLVIAGYDATSGQPNQGLILRSTDAGETWTPVFQDSLSSEGMQFYSIEFNGSVGYVTGKLGFVMKSEDGGETWQKEASPVHMQPVYLRDGKFLANGDFYVVGTSGYVLKKSAGTSVSTHYTPAPVNFAMHQNYPNPFNPTTEIRYQLSKDAKISLSIYNSMGQKIATLVERKQTAGNHRVTWDASKAASGVYFCRMKAEGFNKTMKMLLLK
ncbi:T9SS type A sorting domain-containing protein [candidate division KSB1 bacterium]|nr:T9SS type A sorting domain-containing protein [candidate division KSB1 bacterium]